MTLDSTTTTARAPDFLPKPTAPAGRRPRRGTLRGRRPVQARGGEVSATVHQRFGIHYGGQFRQRLVPGAPGRVSMPDPDGPLRPRKLPQAPPRNPIPLAIGNYLAHHMYVRGMCTSENGRLCRTARAEHTGPAAPTEHRGCVRERARFPECQPAPGWVIRHPEHFLPPRRYILRKSTPLRPGH